MKVPEVGGPILPLKQRRYARRELPGVKWDGTVGAVVGHSPVVHFLVEAATRFNEEADGTDCVANEVAVAFAGQVHGLVEIRSARRVDCDKGNVPPVRVFAQVDGSDVVNRLLRILLGYLQLFAQGNQRADHFLGLCHVNADYSLSHVFRLVQLLRFLQRFAIEQEGNERSKENPDRNGGEKRGRYDVANGVVAGTGTELDDE